MTEFIMQPNGKYKIESWDKVRTGTNKTARGTRRCERKWVRDANGKLRIETIVLDERLQNSFEMHLKNWNIL